MNTYYISDENYKKTLEYQNFIKENPATGSLKIRAYAASQAIPIKGLKVEVSTKIGDDKVIFFEGYTDESGMIEKIKLPAPILNNNLDVPKKLAYNILVTYIPDNISGIYTVNIYENVCVVQNISVVPDMKVDMGGF